MLKQLYIKNFALIDTLDMEFFPGFSVITGETGAGKSIILGAINLLLGQRADSRQIKKGADKCVIEAHFDLSRYDMKAFFDENDIEYDANDTILRRELLASGKSRAFINDTPTSLAITRKLGEQLIDIHSQHQNLMLGNEDFQLKVLDIMAQNAILLEEYHSAYDRLQKARNNVAEAKREMQKAIENEEFYRFQLNELQAANLQHGMQEQLEAEQEKLNHVEDIKGTLYQVDVMLNGNGERSLVDDIREAARTLAGISNVYPEAAGMVERMEDCHIELKDIAHEVGASMDGIEIDPERQKQVNETLDMIYSLEQKHHTDSVDRLIEKRDELEQKILNIDNGDERLKELEQKLSEANANCKEVAGRLTATRRKAATTVERGMKDRLVPLGIPKVRFSISIEPREFQRDGCDAVAFLFSANSSSDMMPISQVASGGEIARVMLSLKAMISNAVKLPTIIFDEIDTGVSGKIAEKMALIMQEMAQSERQVISITHLPQIAARGTTHYKVYKEETENGTESTMTRLNDEQRVNEIAQMLSGSDITDAAKHNAKDLLGA